MDKSIQVQQRPRWHWAALLLVFLLIALPGIRWWMDLSAGTRHIAADQARISEVIRGPFEDVAMIRGIIMPARSVFLDAVDGGVIEEVFVEEGSFVKAGQPLMRLSNSALQLQVANNDTQITEQLNNLKNIVDGFETTGLMTEKELLETSYHIATLQRQQDTLSQLAQKQLVARNDFDTVQDELIYQQQLFTNLQKRQAVEQRIRAERTRQIHGQIRKLEENLEIAMRSLDNLSIRAPIDGQLTSLLVEIGENKASGQRLGQIDGTDNFKVSAQIDEFYAARVAAGHSASFLLSGVQYTAHVDKVYPEIRDGTFTIDMSFVDSVPVGIRRGQTLQLELVLGAPAESLLLPIGAYLQDTGGNWVFVLDEGGATATRRSIITGRRNSRFIEVRESLEVGDRVLTSSYRDLSGAERIKLVR